jgi:hypothetical protein
MKKQKLRHTNLKFFSDMAALALEKELDDLITDVKLGKLTIMEALSKLETATADTHLIFWHIVHEIGDVRIIVRNIGNDAPVLIQHYRLDIIQDTDYLTTDVDDTINDDMAELRVKRNNTRFGYTIDNPSDLVKAEN